MPQSKKPLTNDSDAASHHRLSGIPKWAGIGLFIYASVLVLSVAKTFLVPIVLAFLLSMVFGPVRRIFDRWGIPSVVSSLGIVLTLLGIFLMIATALAVPVTSWMQNAPQIERQVQAKIGAVSQSMHGLFVAGKRLQEMAPGNSKPVQHVQLESSGVLTNTAMLAPSVLAQFLFTFVLLLFLLASGDMFYEKLVHVMPTFKDKRQAVRIVYNIERKLSRYLLAITLINTALGICIGLAMWLLGMPNPLVFGVIACVFNFVPYVGALAGIVIAGGVAMLTFDWIGWAPIVMAVYLGITAAEGQFVTPYFVGRALRLNTVVVFVAVSFWAWLWSAVGMIVAVPLLVAIKTFCDHIEKLEGVGDFLSERHSEQ